MITKWKKSESFNKRIDALASLAKQGNDRAFTKIVALCHNRFRSFISGFGIHETELDDVLQNMFVKIWKGLASYDESHPFFKYAYTIIRNGITDYKRTKRYRLISLEQESSDGNTFDLEVWNDNEDPYHSLIKEERARVLELAIAKIPKHLQTVLRMYYVENRPLDQISKDLGENLSTVKNFIYRDGKGKLQDELRHILKII